jgi:5'-nucleotidase
MEGLPMNRRRFIKNGFLGTAGIGLGATPLGLMANTDLVTISILHTNDLHCHIEPFSNGNKNTNGRGGLARISALAKSIKSKNPNSLLFDAGDMFQGTPYYNYFKGELMLKLMTAVGYDAGTIGNHEFDDGLEGIKNSLPEAGFPLICSNYDFSDTILNKEFPAWKIFNKSGIKIGVYGLGIELKGLVADKNFGNTIYKDPISTALKTESFLRNEKKCDLVVCLSHLGFKYNGNKVSDLVLAGETSLTDLIIGGHTHTFLNEPIVEKNKVGKQVIVNQASWGGLVLGKIDFTLERSNNKKQLVYTQNINIDNEA